MKKADPVRGTCMQAAQKLNDAEMKVVQQKMDAALSGTATCAPKQRKVKVTGTLQCLGPASGE